MPKMTEKQKRFCDYYIETLNATEAAKRAGYSQKTAYIIGAENLKKPQIRECIDQRLAELETKRVANAQEVLEYLTSVMRGESKSEVVVVECVDKGVSVARHVQKAPDERERTKAAELLGKRHQLFTDKLSVEGAIPVVIANADDLED